MPLNKDLDKIVLSGNELVNLLKWRDEHKDLIYDYKQVLSEGIVEVIGGMSVYFKFLDDKRTYFEAFTENIIVCKMTTIRLPKSYITTDDLWIDNEIVNMMHRFDPTFTRKDVIADTCTTVISAMTYLEHFKTEVIRLEHDVHMSNTQRRRAEWHNRNNPNQIIKLKKVVFTIPNGAKYDNATRKRNESIRRAESWSVRGHPRKMKNGKTIWVKPYVKGTGKKQLKIYRVDEI